jgi:branched-chain amino acid transport system permease protein
MINLVLVYVILGIGLNFLLGYAGQFAFAHAALMGIGAYTTAVMTTRLGVSFWIALPLSGVTAMIVGSLGALPAMRMRRVYLALVTLAFAELLHWIFVHWKSVTAGTDGMSVRAPTLFGYSLRGDENVFYVLLAAVVLLYIVGRRIVESRIGRSFVAIRENEIVAQSCGISLRRTKAVVFALSAFYAGIGGSLFALTLGYIVPDSFNLFQLVVHFSIVVIGGLISMYGSIIGAVILTALPELLRDFQALQEIIYGVLLMIFIILMPTGIAGVAKRRGIVPDEILARNWRRLQPTAEAGKAETIA